MRFALLLLAFLTASVAAADTNVYARRVVVNNSAQADAELMTRTGILRHCGRNGGRREGIGMGSTPESALRNCCFNNGRYRIVEQAVAFSPVRRMWFAVIRYE